MNRQQLRKAKKQLEMANKINKTPFAPMLSQKEQFKRQIDQQLERELDKVRMEAANRSFNLILGGMILTLLEEGNSVESIETLIHSIMDKTEATMGNGITFEELMETCRQQGFAIGDMDYDKVKKDADEVMDLIKKYEGMKEMSKKTDVFALCNKGQTDVVEIAKKLSIPKTTATTYVALWKKQNKDMKAMSTEEFADSLFEEEEQEDTVAQEEVVMETEEKKNELEEILEEIHKSGEADHVPEVSKMIEEEKIVEQAGLKKIYKLEGIEGQFATYKPTAFATWDIELDGQIFSLSREQMKVFAKELEQVAEEEI